MRGLSFVGEPALLLLIAFTGFLSASYHHHRPAQRAFMYAVIAFIINTLLKLSLHRRRPHGLVIRTLGIQSYSFPSGHAFGSVIFYGLFALLDIKYLTNPANIIIAALLWIVIFFIGVSRVYLGAHYPSDVIGGWLFGAISLSVVYQL